MTFEKFGEEYPELARHLEVFIVYAQSDEVVETLNDSRHWVVFEVGGTKYSWAAQHDTERSSIVVLTRDGWVWLQDE